MLILSQYTGFNVGGVKIVRNGLQLYLDAGNSLSYPGSGTTWTDLTSNAYTFGQSGSGTTFTSAGASSYFQFNGSGYWSQSAAYSGSIMRSIGRRNYPFTMEFWVYRGATAGATEAFFCTIVSGAHNGTDTYMNSSPNVPRFTPRPLGANVDGSAQIATGAWKQVVIAGQADGSTCTWYTNAVSNGTGTVNNSGWTVGDSTLTGTLCSAQSSDNFQNGSRIAIVRMYDRVLSSTEVLQNFNADKSRYGL